MGNILVAKDNYYGKSGGFHYEVGPNEELKIVTQPPNLADFYPQDYHCHLVRQDRNTIKQKIFNRRNSAVLLKKQMDVGSIINYFRPVPQIIQTISLLDLHQNSRVLDIGCGSGDLLFLLCNAGLHNIEGIDPFLPLKLLECSVPKFYRADLYELDQKFDRIISNHSLEHIYDHYAFFTKIKSILKDRGKILIRTPLSGSLAWKLYKEHWYQLDAPRHLYIHSELSLRRLLKNLEFKVERVIYDSTIHQFARSEVYRRGITSKQFWEKYDGDYTKLFLDKQIKKWQKMVSRVNNTGEADQASFIVTHD